MTFGNPTTARSAARARAFAVVTAVALTTAAAAQPAADALKRGQDLWAQQRLSAGAVAALEEATKDRATAAAAWEALGRIYTYKGWQQEGVFPGWHDETEYRERAIDAFRKSLAAEPGLSLIHI